MVAQALGLSSGPCVRGEGGWVPWNILSPCVLWPAQGSWTRRGRGFRVPVPSGPLPGLMGRETADPQEPTLRKDAGKMSGCLGQKRWGVGTRALARPSFHSLLRLHWWEDACSEVGRAWPELH